MARKKVEQVQCERCRRVELQPVPEAEKTVPDFEAKFGDLHLKFGDLCDRCKGAIATTWKDLEQWDREVKQTLLGEEAAPLSPPPKYTPPQPHSAAAGKK